MLFLPCKELEMLPAFFYNTYKYKNKVQTVQNINMEILVTKVMTASHELSLRSLLQQFQIALHGQSSFASFSRLCSTKSDVLQDKLKT
jgi:hypothetical protein